MRSVHLLIQRRVGVESTFAADSAHLLPIYVTLCSRTKPLALPLVVRHEAIRLKAKELEHQASRSSRDSIEWSGVYCLSLPSRTKEFLSARGPVPGWAWKPLSVQTVE